MLREHVLETASRLFYQEGLRAVGVDRVVAEAGISKATLYRYFDNKEALIVAYLKARHERSASEIERTLEEASASAEQMLHSLFHLLEVKAATADYRGCAFLLAAAEQDDSASVRRLARMHKRAVRALFVKAFGEFVTDAELFADELMVLYDGTLAGAQVSRKTARAQVSLRMALSRLRTLQT